MQTTDMTPQKSMSIRDPAVLTAGLPQATVEVLLTGISSAARDINLYELRRPDGASLPTVHPGAHIDVHIPNGLVRQYSLVHPEANPRCYIIGVKRDAQSRGGSSYLHEQLRAGATLLISPPRNNFPLVETADHTVLIAGGIGITPIWCMWQRLMTMGSSVELVYACRSRSDALFLREMLGKPSVTLHFDDECPGAHLDLARIVARTPRSAHLYCCGPLPMLQAFKSVTADWPTTQVHFEYFAAQPTVANESSFVVELARSRQLVSVARGQTILAAVIAAGIDAPYSCQQGVCGTCVTKVLSGIPDHRDAVLTDAERATNKAIMICCSGSKTNRLVLDL